MKARFLLVLALVVSSFASEAPQISADLGACSADFRVSDAAGKPVYDATVHAYIKYGAFGIRKLDMEVHTDADGHARLVGMPERTKGSLTINVKKGNLSRDVTFDPTRQCHAVYDVVLK